MRRFDTVKHNAADPHDPLLYSKDRIWELCSPVVEWRVETYEAGHHEPDVWVEGRWAREEWISRVPVRGKFTQGHWVREGWIPGHFTPGAWVAGHWASPEWVPPFKSAEEAVECCVKSFGIGAARTVKLTVHNNIIVEREEMRQTVYIAALFRYGKV